MNNEQSELKKAYVTLMALKKNLPDNRDLEEKYANMFNSEVDRLIGLGFEVEDFKVPEQEIKPIFTHGNYMTGEKHYSSGKYVEKQILLVKLDAILVYFSIAEPTTKMGFEAN